MTSVFRFAPSPTGLLHLGHALSALTVWREAEAAGGHVLLRIEDIDPIRSKPDFAAAIEEDLTWLGLAWHGPVRRQSRHLDDHARAVDVLRTKGLLYPCRLSRSDIASALAHAAPDWPNDPDGAPRLPVPNAQASDPEGPLAERLRMNRALTEAGPEPLDWIEHGEGPAGETGRVRARPEAWGDVVLVRKETPTSYHLAVVVDDALQGVTDVVRGRDLFHATSVHRLVQRLLGLPAPVYRHHPLLSEASGVKLSKSRGSPSLRGLRAEGWTPDDVRRAVEAI